MIKDNKTIIKLTKIRWWKRKKENRENNSEVYKLYDKIEGEKYPWNYNK